MNTRVYKGIASACSRALALALCSLVLLHPSARAASASWTAPVGAPNANWSTSTNWTPAAAPGDTNGPISSNTDTATFNTALTGGNIGGSTDPVIIDQTGQAIQNISYGTAAGNYQIGTNGGNTLFLTNKGVITDNGGSQVIAAPLAFTGTSYALTDIEAGSTPITLTGAISSALTSGISVFTINSNNTAQNVNLNGNISDGASGGVVALVLSTNNTGINSAEYIILAGNNSFSGGVTVNAFAPLDLHSATALGTGNLTLNNNAVIQNTSNAALTLTTNNTITLSGGTLNVTEGTGSSALKALNLGTGAVTMNGSETILFNHGSANLTIGGAINDGGHGYNLTVSAGTGTVDTLFLGGANSYTGSTTVNTGATLDIDTATGSISTTSGVTVNSGGTFALDDTAGNNTNSRLGTANLTLNNATFNVLGNASANSTETTGTLALNGNDTITITPATGQVTTLSPSTLTRGAQATALFRGTSLNQSATTNVARVVLGDGGASLGLVGTNQLNGGATNDNTQALKIVPYLFGDITAGGNGTNFVTYDSTLGLRVLTNAEDTTLAAGATTAASPVNAVAFSGVVTTPGLTVNSLLFNGATQTLNGSGTLTINSGALAGVSTADVIGGGFSSIALGNGEGVITVVSGDALTLNAPLNVTGAGSDDLVKTGAGTLTVANGTLYTGPTVVQAGTLVNSSSIAGPITLNNSANLTIAGSTAVTTGTVNGIGGGASITYTNTLAAGNTVPLGAGVNSLATVTDNSTTGKLFLAPASGAAATIATVNGASGSIVNFDGAANSTVTISNLLNTIGQLVVVSSGTVNANSGRSVTDNLEVDGGDLVYTNTADRLSLNQNNQTLKITGGELNVISSTYGLRINGDNGASGSGNSNTTINSTQTGGLLLINHGGTILTFSMGSSTASANVSNYNLSGGTLDALGSGAVGSENGYVDLGADTTGQATSTFTLSGSGLLIASSTIQGDQGVGAKQAFVFNGGTLTTANFIATNLTSTNGVAVSASTNTLNNNGGKLAPGLIAPVTGGGLTAGTQYTGKTAITGNYSVNSGAASLAINVGGATAAGGFGTTAADYDNVSVSGATTLGGKLNVGLINSYTPPVATNFNILVGSASGVTGNFTNLVTATGGNARVVLSNGLSSFIEAINNTAGTASVGGLTGVTARTVAIGQYQATNTYNAASGSAWDAANAANWTYFDPGSTSNPATVASGAIAQFADGASTGSGPNTVTLNSTRNIQGIQFASAVAGKNYTINDAGNGTSSVILDNTGNSAPATIADSSASGNANAINVPLTLNSALNISVTNAANVLTIGGAITGGASLPVTVSGSGTTVLAAVNNYSGGTSVGSTATLVVAGSISGATSVSGVLEGTGTVGGLVTVNAGGTLAPGLSNGSVAAANLTESGNLSYAGAGNFNIRLGVTSNGPGGILDNDSLTMTSGTVGSLAAVTLKISTGAAYSTSAATGLTFIILNGGYTPAAGVFANDVSNTITASNGDVYSVLYGYDPNTQMVDSSGNDIALQLEAVPEPGTWAMLLSGAGMLVVLQRKRRRTA